MRWWRWVPPAMLSPPYYFCFGRLRSQLLLLQLVPPYICQDVLGASWESHDRTFYKLCKQMQVPGASGCGSNWWEHSEIALRSRGKWPPECDSSSQTPYDQIRLTSSWYKQPCGACWGNSHCQSWWWLGWLPPSRKAWLPSCHRCWQV